LINSCYALYQRVVQRDSTIEVRRYLNKAIFDLSSDYLLSSFGQVTATGLARLLDGDLSHDQVTRTLADEKLTSKSWW
jgi:hypothetical protein